MEFGLEGLDGNGNGNGSGLVKQERSDPFDNGDSKMGKQSDAFGLRSDINSKQQMLSFSTNSRTSMGFGSGNTNGSLHGSFTGIRGPFTPAQWIELEHQAMIYKYFTANVPVPSNLLLPIRKAIQSAGFPGFSIGSYSSHSYGWGAFHLGFSNNTDPEPGRCRRTDGKKWRCSRDAVPDQKYCERHINRGRHRSRKPVEGQTGQAASGTATPKVVPAMSASMSPLVQTCGGVPSGAAIAQHNIKGLQPAGAINASTDPITKRLVDQQGLSMMPPTINLESKGSQYSIPKQHISFDESSASDFGVVSNDSFLNPTQKRSYLDSKCYNSLMDFNNQQTGDQSTLRHFVDNWPKDQSDRSTPPWPKDQSDCSTAPWPKDLKPDWTQLSMSIPMSADFSSSSSSPIRELDPSRLGPGVGTIVAEEGTRQNPWTPVTWGNSNSMGGPLGEVLLNNANNTLDKAGNSQLGFSPTGVLQKSTFVSLSNSSSGGSPRGDLLGSAARANSTSIPSL